MRQIAATANLKLTATTGSSHKGRGGERSEQWLHAMAQALVGKRADIMLNSSRCGGDFAPRNPAQRKAAARFATILPTTVLIQPEDLSVPVGFRSLKTEQIIEVKEWNQRLLISRDKSNTQSLDQYRQTAFRTLRQGFHPTPLQETHFRYKDSHPCIAQEERNQAAQTKAPHLQQT